jgi:hypothetical protein
VWSAQNEAELDARRGREANEKRNLVEEADAERTLFHSQRAKKIEATKAAHRAAQKGAAEAAAEGASVWEKAVQLIESDAKPKADLTKFKALLVKLKHAPAAPGVAAA